MSQFGTNFVESEAILAAQDGTPEDLRMILQPMLSNELLDLRTAALRLVCTIGAILDSGAHATSDTL